MPLRDKEAGLKSPLRRRAGIDFPEWEGINLQADASAIGVPQLRRGVNVRRRGGRLQSRGGQAKLTSLGPLTGCPVGLIEANRGGIETWLYIPAGQETATGGPASAGPRSLQFYSPEAGVSVQTMEDGEMRAGVAAAARWGGPGRSELGTEDVDLSVEEPGAQIYLGLAIGRSLDPSADDFIGQLRILPKQEIPYGSTFADDGQRTIPKATRPRSQNGADEAQYSGGLTALLALGGHLIGAFGSRSVVFAGAPPAQMARFDGTGWIIEWTDPATLGINEAPGLWAFGEWHEEVFAGNHRLGPAETTPSERGRNLILRRKHDGTWAATTMPAATTHFDVWDFAVYNDVLYCCGQEANPLAGNPDGHILRWNPVTPAWEVAHTIAAPGPADAKYIRALLSANGFLYYLHTNLFVPQNGFGQNADIKLGRYDGNTFTDTHKDFSAQVGVTPNPQADHLDYAGLLHWRGNIYAWVHLENGPRLMISPGTNTTGTWTKVTLPFPGVLTTRNPLVPL